MKIFFPAAELDFAKFEARISNNGWYVSEEKHKRFPSHFSFPSHSGSASEKSELSEQ
jgi:hypothetical protein